MSERNFFNTRAAQVAMQSLDRINDEQIIGMVVARPGIGKTQAIKHWLSKRGPSFRRVWIEADVLTSPRPILTALVQAMGIAPSAGRAAHMHAAKERVAEALAIVRRAVPPLRARAPAWRTRAARRASPRRGRRRAGSSAGAGPAACPRRDCPPDPRSAGRPAAARA